LQQNFADMEVHSMRMAVEETEGQLGVWYYNEDRLKVNVKDDD
jgi:hypothetical protein